MKPPICSICDERFFAGGGLIYFTEDEQDKEFNERLKEKGFVGHPTNAFWFCEKHYDKAKEYSNFTKGEAFKLMKE